MAPTLRILKFRISGDYAHFRVRYTTSSSATYLVPPRHTVAGIIGAILGVQRDEVSKLFNPPKCRIGLEVDHLPSTVRIPLKRLKIKSRTLSSFRSITEHNIVPYHMIRDPSYIIYFSHEDADLMDRLEQMLRAHECVYPPSLGLAKLLADVEFFGVSDYNVIEEDSQLTTKSMFPMDHLSIYPSPANNLVMERFALYLDETRQGYRFHQIMVDISGTEVEGDWKVNDFATALKDPKSGETIVVW